MQLHPGLSALLVCAALQAQGITFLEGTTPSALDVRVLDESRLDAPPALVRAAIEILPIEINGRLASQELRTDVARVDLRNGLPRVELPRACRLFAYRRLGGLQWGFLHVPDSGIARVVLELPGRGPAGTDSPFLGRIAVAAGGQHMVVPAAAGGCHVVRLDGGAFASTGQAARFVAAPVPIDLTSVMTGATHAFFTGDDRIFRFLLADGGVPTEHTPAIVAQDPRLKDELAMSGDGSTVAFLHGADNDTLQIWLLDSASATARLVPTGPHGYEEPGYLPEAAGHSRLLLNHAATRLFFVRDGDPVAGQQRRDESFLLDTTGTLPTLHITQDAIFQPYIGVHILPSFRGDQLVLAVGDIDRLDWFAASLSAGGGTVGNLTGTGAMATPFPAGTLVPDRVKFAGPAGQIAFATDGTGSNQTLRTIDLVTGQSRIVYQDVPADPVAGSSTGPVGDFLVPGPGDRVFAGATGRLVGATPPGFLMTPPLTSSWFGVTKIALLPNWGLLAFYLPTGEVVFDFLTLDLQQVTVTHRDGVVLRSGASVRYLADQQPTRVVPLPAAPPLRVFVSGAGG